MLPNPNKKDPKLIFFFCLNRKYERTTPRNEINKNINAPVFELILHSLNNFHSSPRIKPKVTFSVLSELR
jgi:hypothetical protein